MKKRILFSVLTLFLLFVGLQPVHAQESFTIEHYDIQIEVSEDGVYTVTETLDVQFQQRPPRLKSHPSQTLPQCHLGHWG